MRRTSLGGVLLWCILALGTSSVAGCSSSDNSSAPAGVTSPHIKTVFLILMENKTWSEIKGSSDAPYVNETLLPQASLAEAYRGANKGVIHPSEPNYLWLEAGDNFGIYDDNDPDANHQSTTDHFVTQLEGKGISWRSYQEDITGDACPLTSIGDYKPKHNPMVFFDDVTNSNDPASPRCIEHVRPLTELETDLGSNKVGRYNFVTPNQCNDMHSVCDGTEIKQGDDWLSTWIPKIQASEAYQDAGAILLTWDEAELTPDCPVPADCPIGMLALSPLAKGKGYTNTIDYDHSSTLKSLQEIFDVAPHDLDGGRPRYLRAAAGADVEDLRDLFKSFP